MPVSDRIPTVRRLARRAWAWAPVAVVALIVSACMASASVVVERTGTIRTAPASTPGPTLTPIREESRPASAALESNRPNVVMVMADDMRVDDLDFAPNVRKLIASNGLTFENSFSPFPLCCPARASFLTGQYAHNHEVYWHNRPYGYAAFDDSRTLATSLKRAGYNTGFIGKYLNKYGPATSKVSGQPSYTYVPNGWTDWVGAFEDPGVKGISGGTYYYWNTPYNVNGRVDNTHAGEYQTNTVGDFSVKMANNYARSNDPFFMYVSYVAPHHGGPRENDDTNRFHSPARPDWVQGKFDHRINRASGLPKGGGPSEADVSDKMRSFRNLSEFSANERRALLNLTRQRAEAIYVLDRQVGRLVKELKRTGEWANTVLMFTSDNGYFLGEHRRRPGKVRAHEPSLRVPFVVTGPGLRDGERRFDPISTVDVTATILDIANARAPRAPDGISRWDTMLSGDQGWEVPVVTEGLSTIRGKASAPGFTHGEVRSSIGLRTPRYSFTLYRTGAGELYDLLADPAQNDNKFRDRGYRTVRNTLTAAWWEYKDCAGITCRVPMSPEFGATPAKEKSLTRRYWDVIDRMYGR